MQAKLIRQVLTLVLLGSVLSLAADEHQHPVPEKLGTVSFPTSCQQAVQPAFDRAVALLHSFSYKAAEEAFESVSRHDPNCAMSHWGMAMTHFHQLWDLPPSTTDTAAAQQQIALAASGKASERERGFIRAIALVFNNAATVPYRTRAEEYEAAMQQLALANPADVETQVFYALALISNASPSDREHHKQKLATGLLAPLFRNFPDHPGIPHYLIHACDNQELASSGLAAARAYAAIAPSAPHALHMPSHIFTRLGLWDDSIAANRNARREAQNQGDTGEQLHAMDYLVYAYLQTGRDSEALQVVQQIKAMQNLPMGSFKVGYAATAIPVRYLVERQQWDLAQQIANPPAGAQPHVVALAVWARGLGFARTGQWRNAGREVETLGRLEGELRAAGNAYWATEVGIMKHEVTGWSAQARKEPKEAVAILAGAAEDEDRIEKLPVTPGPVLPAREQLGELFLEQGNAAEAAKAFQIALVNAPGRRRSLHGAAQAAARL